jgi:hypothetical protein
LNERIPENSEPTPWYFENFPKPEFSRQISFHVQKYWMNNGEISQISISIQGFSENLSRISFLLFSTLLSTAARADFCYVSINNGETIEDSLRWEIPSFKTADFDPNVPLVRCYIEPTRTPMDRAGK